MSHNASHPEPTRLSAFARGLLNDTEIGAVETHLLECARCCDAVAGVPEDEFQHLARLAASTCSWPAPADKDATPPPGEPETLPPEGAPDLRRLGRFRLLKTL